MGRVLLEVERKIMLLALLRLMSETELESRLLLQLITQGRVWV